MMASGFRVRVTGLVFKLASLVLKQVPICISKPQANTFDKSIVFNIGHFWSIQMVLSHFRWFLVGFRLFQVVLNCFSSFLTLVKYRLRSFQVVLAHSSDSFSSLYMVLAHFRWFQVVSSHSSDGFSSFQMVLGCFRMFQLVPQMILAHYRWFQLILDGFSSFQIILSCFSSFLTLPFE